MDRLRKTFLIGIMFFSVFPRTTYAIESLEEIEEVVEETEVIDLEADPVSGDWSYRIEGGYATVTKYNGFLRDVSVPSALEGYTVTAIGDCCFDGNTSMISVIIPDTITLISRAAFDGCTNLRQVAIPASVVTIGNYAFFGCSNLRTVTFADGVGSVGGIGEYAFENCANLTSVSIPGSVTGIGNHAFENCTILKTLSIGNGVTCIGSSAFYNCASLTGVVIPGSVSTIGESAFHNCIYLKTLTISSGVTTIGNSAFRDCERLTSVNIPDTVTTIGDNSFNNCKAIKTLTIGKGVQSIGGSAFNGCESLTYVDIPSNVKTIGSSAFTSCTNIKNVGLHEGLKSIDSSVFDKCTSLTTISVPGSVEKIPFHFVSGCTALEHIEIKYGTVEIGNEAFCECKSLKILSLPNSLKNIDSTPISNCNALERVYFDGTEEEWVKIDGNNEIPFSMILFGKMPTGIEMVSKLLTLKTGEIRQLLANVLPEDSADKTVIWSSSDPDVVSVDDAGNIRAIKSGTAIISAITYDGGYKDTCSVTVCTPVTGIFLEKKEANLALGKTITLKANIDPENADNKDITWISNDVSIANVNENGEVTALKSGVAIITATTVDGNYTAVCTITVAVPVTGISMSESEKTMKVGESVILEALVEPENADNTNIQWSSSNSSVVSVDNDGRATALKPGNAVIIATTEEGKYTDVCMIIVETPVESIALNKSNLNLLVGGVEILKADIRPANAVNRRIWWESSNYSIVTVDEEGRLTALKVGNASITAKSENGEHADTCEVQVQFNDVKEANKSFYDPVYWAVEKGVTTGTSATMFSPGNSCTRAQFVTFLWRALGQPEPKTKKNPFTDVPEGKSFSKAVLWAYENNITTGTSKTEFSPSKPCTRAQVATFLWRAEGQPEPKINTNPFTDVPMGKSFSKAVLWAFENNITTGTSKTTFAPSKTCIRAQTVTFLYRTYKEN